ncbi:MAG: hypothetical protein AB7T49_18090 [Oligoflexales bacterium]
MTIRFLVIAIAILCSKISYSYPNYISYGYQSCLTCHYNPYGNGPLTDYGRALSATEISDRLFTPPEVSEDEIAEKSSFLGREPVVEWLRPSLSYRSLLLSKNFGDDDQKEEFILMDVSAALVAKFLQNDKLILVGQIGYAPVPRAVKGSDDMKTYRSREHYFGYRITKEIGVYAGLMDKVFGIRVPDHIAFSRTMTGLTQNDQAHGVLFHYFNKYFETGLQPFVGNLVQDESLRQKGVTGQFEVTLSERARVGMSGLSSKSEFLEMLMYSYHARLGLGQGNSLLAEMGEVGRTNVESEERKVSQYVFTQTHYHLKRGLWSLLTTEVLRADKTIKAYTYRLGPGVQWFPLRGIELRADAYNSHQISEDKKDTKSWDLTTQLHLYL